MAQDASAPPGAAVTTIDPYTAEFILDPYPGHAELRRLGPVVWLDKYGCFATARYAPCHAILADHKRFASGAGVGYNNFRKDKPWRPPSLLLEADQPEHTPRRAVVGRILSAPNLRGFRAAFEVEANKLIDRLLEARDADGMTDAAQAFVLKVFPDAVGITPEGRHHLLTYGTMVFNAFGVQNHIFEESARDAGTIGAWILDQCRHENLRPGGLGDQVYQAVPSGMISADEAMILVRSFLSAGVDTTIDGIGNALWSYATNPAEWAKVKENPGLVKQGFEEVLRYESPFQSFFRTTNEDVELGGVRIPGNEKIMVIVGAANRDPDKWTRPDTFDVNRNPRDHLGLGHGIHACIGQMVSRLEAEVFFTALAQRKVDFTLTGTARRKVHNVIRGFETIPMRFTAP